MHAEGTRLKITKYIHIGGVFRIRSDICDGAFLKKIVNGFQLFTILSKKVPSHMFDWTINTPLHMDKLFNNISFCCNTEQLQNGRYDTSFFTHLHQEKSPLQVQVNMYISRLTSYTPHQSTENLLSLEYFHLQSTGVEI